MALVRPGRKTKLTKEKNTLTPNNYKKTKIKHHKTANNKTIKHIASLLETSKRRKTPGRFEGRAGVPAGGCLLLREGGEGSASDHVKRKRGRSRAGIL